MTENERLLERLRAMKSDLRAIADARDLDHALSIVEEVIRSSANG